LFQVPEAIVSCGGLGTNLQTGELPSSLVLKDGGQSEWAFVADKVLDHDRVFACCAREGELRAAGARAFCAIDAAVKCAVRIRRITAIEQEIVAELRFGAGKSVLVVVDRAGNAVEARLELRHGI